MEGIIMEKDIHLLKTGDIIAEDIFFNNTLIIKKGTQVNPLLKEKLKKWGFNCLPIVEEVMIEDELNEMISKLRDTVQSGKLNTKELSVRNIFYETLLEVADERRYGLALNEESSILFLEDLFISFMKKEFVYELVFKLMDKDEYSFKHSFDVFVLFTLLMKKRKVANIEKISMAALLHDIGKIEITPKILNKEQKLTVHEFETIKDHAFLGFNLLRNHPDTQEFAYFSRDHHERLDGSGYPMGLTSDQIDQNIRVLMIIDVYSALTLKRPYREPVDAYAAMEILLSDKGSYSVHLLKEFMMMMNIFPIGTVLLLDSGILVKVTAHIKNAPYILQLMDMGTQASHQLNLTYSEKVVNIIRYESMETITKMDVIWTLFMNQLVRGNKRDADKLFNLLTEGKSIEEILTILLKGIKQIRTLSQNGIISEYEVKMAEGVIHFIKNLKLGGHSVHYQEQSNLTFTAFPQSS
jgi:putative nucleotidyltransferase with HDIG domain